jgi:polysaccharide pyruvyl transferase WcaK-like protein
MADSGAVKRRRRILLANLYSAQNRGDMLIARGTLELLRTTWPDADYYGMTTFRASSLRYLAEDVEEYRSIFVQIFGNPSDVILSPHEFAELSTPQLVAHYVAAALRDLSHLVALRGRSDRSPVSETPSVPQDFDLVTFVGGSYLQVPGRFHPNLPGHLFIAYLCRRSGVRYIFLGESIRGSAHLEPRLLLKVAFAGSSLVVFRDPISMREAIHNRLVSSPDPNCLWLPDMALGLTPSLQPYRRLRSKRSPVTVGVAFRTWRAKDEQGHDVDVVGLVARALSRVLRAKSVKVILIPFSRISDSRTDDDVSACVRLKSAILALSPSADVGLCLPRVGTDLSGLASLFDQFDMNICVRMHATIFSAMLGIPSVTIEYEGHKSKGVCSYLGLSDYYVGSTSEEEIVGKTLSLLEDYDRASGTVSQRVDASYDLLRSELLRLLSPMERAKSPAGPGPERIRSSRKIP